MFDDDEYGDNYDDSICPECNSHRDFCHCEDDD